MEVIQLVYVKVGVLGIFRDKGDNGSYIAESGEQLKSSIEVVYPQLRQTGS